MGIGTARSECVEEPSRSLRGNTDTALTVDIPHMAAAAICYVQYSCCGHERLTTLLAMNVIFLS